MFKKNWAWAMLGALALIIRYWASLYPMKTEEFYSRSFFPGIRNLIDLTLSRLPFPTVYLFLISILFFVGRYFFFLWRKQGWKSKVLFSFRSFFNFVGAIVFFFLVLWGFNYQRVPIFEQVGLMPKALNEQELLREVELTRNILTQLRPNLEEDTTAIEKTIPYPELEELVRSNIRENLYLLGLNFTGKPRTKLFYPSGFMRKMGILGIYFPFTGESYIDPTLHALEKPFTVAHEMAHSYGVTDEGEANFIGWVICTNSDDVLLQYSGQLRLFRYQLNDLYRINKETYKTFLPTIDQGIRNDLASIARNTEAIQPFSMELSRKSNDLFLKTQGVKAGVMSYQQLPMLAYAWRNKLKEST